jgi:hypothetical protein
MTPSASSGAGAGLCSGRYSWVLRLGLHRDLAGRSHLQIGFQEPLAGIEAGLLLALHDWLHEHPAFTTLALVYYFCASFTTTGRDIKPGEQLERGGGGQRGAREPRDRHTPQFLQRPTAPQPAGAGAPLDDDDDFED